MGMRLSAREACRQPHKMSFAYIGHIVERRRKVLGVRKTISILRSARRGKEDLKPWVMVLYLILGTVRALRATRNVCELKRRCLDHIVSNTRCYSPSAAVAACSCGGPAGSVLPVLSSVRHRIPYWSGRIDVVTLYVNGVRVGLAPVERTRSLSRPYRFSSMCKHVTFHRTLFHHGHFREHPNVLWHLIVFLT